MMSLRSLVTATTFTLVSLIATTASASVVSQWNAAALEEVRLSTALRNGPPMVARALAIVHTCMYDAWAAYDDVALGTVLGDDLRQPRAERTRANKKKALSFAAYRCLLNLYPDDGSAKVPPAALGLASTPSARLTNVLAGLGYSTADASTPAAVGSTAAQAVIDSRANDGANQYGDGWCPSADPGHVCPSAGVVQPLGVVACTGGKLDLPPGSLVGPLPCVGPGGVGAKAYADYDDPASGYTHYVPRNPLMGFCNPIFPLLGCPDPDPFLLDTTWPRIFDVNHWQPLIFSSHAKQTFIGPYFARVTPFALRSSDQFDHLRHIEPDIFRNERQYRKAADEVLRASAGLTDRQKLTVEYWADGPDSELPPGHWGIFAQFVSDRDNHSVDEDVKMFFAMHNASFDAGIVGWHLKRKFDGVRPITAIRYLYDGKKVVAYGGPGRPVEEIDGERWMPYNPGTNLTPPFPGYVSGHSIFSAASAEVLKRFTGSDRFGFSTEIPACDPAFFLIDFTKCFGRVEPGIPVEDTTIRYRTFSDAADDAAISRLLGGIHFSEDNVTGQQLGRLVGKQAWERAQRYFNGDRHHGHGHGR